MGGALALGTEVVAGLYEAETEEHGPETIHGHSGSEWVFRRDDPAGQCQAVYWLILGQRRPTGRRSGSNLLPLMLVIASHEHEGVSRFFHFVHHHAIGYLGQQIVFLLAQLIQVLLCT